MQVRSLGQSPARSWAGTGRTRLSARLLSALATHLSAGFLDTKPKFLPLLPPLPCEGTYQPVAQAAQQHLNCTWRHCRWNQKLAIAIGDTGDVTLINVRDRAANLHVGPFKKANDW